MLFVTSAIDCVNTPVIDGCFPCLCITFYPTSVSHFQCRSSLIGKETSGGVSISYVIVFASTEQDQKSQCKLSHCFIYFLLLLAVLDW